eukprot:4803724-Alexandrium_andersonii.AAC.1
MCIRDRGDPDVQKLRQRTKNTLLAALEVLSHDRMQIYAQLVFCFAQPVYNRHSDNAADARSPDE